jgi:hypothetical protein
MHLSCFPYVSHVLPIPISWLYHTNNISWGVRIIKLLVCSLSSPVACYFGFLRPKVILSTLLSNTPLTFLPQCDRPRFAPMYTNRWNYIFVYLNLYIFG